MTINVLLGKLQDLELKVKGYPNDFPPGFVVEIQHLITLAESAALMASLPPIKEEGQWHTRNSSAKWWYKQLTFDREVGAGEVALIAKNCNYWGYHPGGYGGFALPCTPKGVLIYPYIDAVPIGVKSISWMWRRFHTSD